MLRRLIAESGPISVARYMALCLGHPRHGYYATHDPFAAGDFTTAPEISQMFGESLAVWCALMWGELGAPTPVALVELGPGCGTMMADVTRTLERIAPDLAAAAEIHLIETSPVLQARQAQSLTRRRISWHDDLSRIPAMSLLLLANEFFDSLPVLQFVRARDAWHERCVDWSAEQQRFIFCAGRRVAGEIPTRLADADEGTIYEINLSAAALGEEIGRRIAEHNGAALIIDYARPGAAGDTLAAIHGRTKDADPLAAPGAADLSTRVDFAALGQSLSRGGAQCYGPIAQRDLLLGLGIEARCASLVAAARPDQVQHLQRGFERLLDPAAMGTLFQALGAVTRSSPPPPAFGGLPA